MSVTSTDVNDYLRSLTGREITAKDFRTWAGTVLAANLLHEIGKPDSATAAKRQIREALHQVATRLGNTVAICRKCYVHPHVLAAATQDVEWPQTRNVKALAGLSRDETAVLRFLELVRRGQQRLGRAA